MNTQKRSKDFDKMIIEAVKGNYKFFAWQSIAGVVEKCELKLKAFRKDYNEIEMIADDKSDGSLTRVISGNRMLNIYVPELSIAFSTELKSIGVDKNIKIYLPKDFTFYERRKHERIHAQNAWFASFEYNKKVIKKTVYDVSYGGFALILPRSDKINIAKGKMLDLVTIEIGTKRIRVRAECIQACSIDRYKLEDLPYGGYKLAFRFTGISKEDRAYLVEVIAHEILVKQVSKKSKLA